MTSIARIREFDRWMRSKRRFTALALCIAGLWLGLGPPSEAHACSGIDLVPATATEIRAAERATTCLINRERHERGRRNLRENRRLDRASVKHGLDMVMRGYFAHQRSGGLTFDRRIKREGYGRRRSTSLGENIAWGSAGIATPREIVNMWMDSPGHRSNILNRPFRHSGLTIVRWEGTVEGQTSAAPDAANIVVAPDLNSIMAKLASSIDATPALSGDYAQYGPVLVYVHDFGRVY